MRFLYVIAIILIVACVFFVTIAVAESGLPLWVKFMLLK